MLHSDFVQSQTHAIVTVQRAALSCYKVLSLSQAAVAKAGLGIMNLHFRISHVNCSSLNREPSLQVGDNIKLLEGDMKEMKHMQAIATAGIVTLCDSLEKIVGQGRNGQAPMGMLRQYLSWFRSRNPLQGEEIAQQLPVSECALLSTCRHLVVYQLLLSFYPLLHTCICTCICTRIHTLHMHLRSQSCECYRSSYSRKQTILVFRGFGHTGVASVLVYQLSVKTDLQL